MKHAVGAAFMAFVLLVPFCLRERLFFWWANEPYPAVLFPVGAGKVNIDGGVVHSRRIEIFAVDEEGKEHELDPVQFFHPIPTPYWTRIASQSKKFGLATPNAEVPLRKRVGSWQLSLFRHRSSTDEEKLEVGNWLLARLQAVGRMDDRLIVVRARNTSIETAEGRELASEVIYEYRIRLEDDEIPSLD